MFHLSSVYGIKWLGEIYEQCCLKTFGTFPSTIQLIVRMLLIYLFENQSGFPENVFDFRLDTIDWLVRFYCISTLVGYLIPNPVYTYIKYICSVNK